MGKVTLCRMQHICEMEGMDGWETEKMFLLLCRSKWYVEMTLKPKQLSPKEIHFCGKL